MFRLKMAIGFLFSVSMLIWEIINRKKIDPFTFYLATVIISFAIIIFFGQLIGN